MGTEGEGAMTSTVKDLISLLDRVRAAEKSDREIDAAIFEAIDPNFPTGALRMWGLVGQAAFATGAYTSVKASTYTSSIDAAVALAERVLPGELWKVSSNFDEVADEAEPAYWARMRSPRLHFAATPALALLAAVLSALIAKESK